MYGLGTMRLQPLGYNFVTGGANYYTPESASTSAVGLPTNCIGPGGQQTPDLPPDGGLCFMVEFPFVGRKQYGCGSEVVQGGYGNPYVTCRPVVLASEGFDFISPLIRIGATGLIAWMLLRRSS